MLARLERARHSKDIDVYFAEQSAAVSDAISALRRALSCDFGDLFGFEFTRIVPFQEEAKGSRVHMRPRWAPRPSRSSTLTSWFS